MRGPDPPPPNQVAAPLEINTKHHLRFRQFRFLAVNIHFFNYMSIRTHETVTTNLKVNSKMCTPTKIVRVVRTLFLYSY